MLTSVDCKMISVKKKKASRRMRSDSFFNPIPIRSDPIQNNTRERNKHNTVPTPNGSTVTTTIKTSVANTTYEMKETKKAKLSLHLSATEL